MSPLIFRQIHLLLTLLLLPLTLSILGTTAHPLQIYTTQSSSNPWFAPLWPAHITLADTHALLAFSILSLLCTSLSLLLLALPRLRLPDRPTLRAVLCLALALPPAATGLITVVYAHVRAGQALELGGQDTLRGWTCAMKGGVGNPEAGEFDLEPQQEQVQVPGDQSNRGFARLCTESSFALHASLALFLLYLVLMGVIVAGWVAEQWAKRRRGKESEWQDASSLEMNRVDLGVGKA